ncbi:competence protein CoiA [Streptococcus loxodontisalivarius]|uniref:Competence protein CoiA n=1 Tax=Streptococcus loxodontisalivarius TaxID=1349415 RepID=A0ABS2PSX5_9STRE|nr:competence protein CoiA family protein [Streptococcus loxodontisalivarius]MBM7643031.1 competence protein CoiA [Streptococcus loxodontisalivarius]
MLLARRSDGDLQNVLIDSIERTRAYFCPACGGRVIYKAGKVMQAHFAHQSLKDCHFFHENESAEHLQLKALLYQSLSRIEHVEIEKYLADMEQIADLMVNDKLALEVQCSSLSLERLKERSHAYHEKGYQVLWLLGKKLWLKSSLSSLQRNFLYFSQNMGFHLWELDAARSLLRLKYLIYEDRRGKVSYLVKEFPFSEDIMSALRQPFMAQSLQSYTKESDQNLSSYIQRQLFSKNPYWMRRQEEVYLTGSNLLTKTWQDFYPHYRFPENQQGFCQIRQDLNPYYQAFQAYYESVEDKARQKLYPPAFYRMKADSHK